MMRTRRARTAVRLGIASTIVPRSRTTLPTSSAVSAVMPVTWPAIAQTDSGALAGAMTVQWVLGLGVVLAEVAMLLIASMRYVDKRFDRPTRQTGVDLLTHITATHARTRGNWRCPCAH
jgi:hypothetical protein